MTRIKTLALLTALLLLFLNSAARAYDFPTGIPAPDFGPVLGDAVSVPLPVNPPAWPGREAPGYYYIDNTAASATDSANTYGFPNRPRQSIPKYLPAGSMVEVRGGPYHFTADANLTLDGTATRPVFLYGVNHPVLAPLKTVVSGSYFVFDGFALRNSVIHTKGMAYAVIRNNDVQGSAGTPNGVKINGNHVVVYNNNIHHHQGDDKHGVNIMGGSHDVWILGNRLHHNGGDGIQFCNMCSASPPRYVYIGGNVIYGNRENGVDLKYCNRVVISRNEIYNHWPSVAGVRFCYDDGSGCTTGSSGSEGESILVGSNGKPGNVWVLFNEVYDSNKGIRLQETSSGFVLGNVIHDVESVGIEIEQTDAGPVTAAFNTIHNTEKGIRGPRAQGVLRITLDDNILSGISGDSIDILYAGANNPTASNNLFYNGGGDIAIRWNSQAYPASGPEIDSLVAGSGNLVGNPMFSNTSASDFHVLAAGAGVDRANSRLVTLNDQFRSIFGNGVSLLRDFADAPRSSAGTGHDIGAYESNSPAGHVPPSPPVLH